MDWVAGALNVLGTFLLAKHRMTAIKVYVAACVLWFVWGTYERQWAVALPQLIYFVLNVRTYLVWRRQ
jgi:hypothetical protein